MINEESDRLNRLVGEAVEMAQLDAREVKLEMRILPIQDAVDAAMEEAKNVTAGHPIEVRLPERLPLVVMDLNWIRKVLQHLLENAAKYSATRRADLRQCGSERRSPHHQRCRPRFRH